MELEYLINEYRKAILAKDFSKLRKIRNKINELKSKRTREELIKNED